MLHSGWPRLTQADSALFLCMSLMYRHYDYAFRAASSTTCHTTRRSSMHRILAAYMYTTLSSWHSSCFVPNRSVKLKALKINVKCISPWPSPHLWGTTGLHNSCIDMYDRVFIGTCRGPLTVNNFDIVMNNLESLIRPSLK